MESINNKIIISGVLMILIFIFGFLTTGSGKPYNPFLFGIHKIISVGVFIFLVINIIKLNQVSPLSSMALTMCILAGIFFFITMVSGGIISIEKEMPILFTRLHKFLPYFTAFFSAAAFFLIWTKA